MNPNHYNENGTVKKGHKQWNFSKRYQKLKQRHQELCRIAAENRALAIREQVNHLRSLGDCFITEPPNAKKLQKRANPENPVDKNGRMKRKKRFGRSIKNRCPGYLQAKAKQLFESTGGMYVEVPILYRASQYDHTSDVSAKVLVMYADTRTPSMEPQWLAAGLSQCLSFLPNCVIASENTRQKTRIAQGKNGNKENEVSEASAVKSRSEQETK